MKKIFVQFCIIVFNYILKFIYSIFKLFRTNKNKILFCSRQMNEVPLDFQLIQQELKVELPEVECVNICCHIGKSVKDYILFFIAIIKSMFHLATCTVCVLDSYWPAASILKHKKNLTVIQLWHSIGKIKKSGYAAIGKRSGRKQEYAKLLHMHENYDYVIAGAKAWNEFYCESFNITDEKILNYGLPRIDYLIETEERNRMLFYEMHPDLKNKTVVLYAPTFRRNMESHWEKIIDAVKDKEIVLIIKTHPGEKRKIHTNAENIFYFDDWKTIDLLSCCDYVITDYSAISLEAAVINKKTYYWIYDYDEYVINNGLNIEIPKVMKENASKDIYQIINMIKKDEYNYEVFDSFKNQYLIEDIGTSQHKILNLIKNCMN